MKDNGLPSYIKITPIPMLLVLVSTTNSLLKFGKANSRTSSIAFFNYKKASSALDSNGNPPFSTDQVSGLLITP